VILDFTVDEARDPPTAQFFPEELLLLAPLKIASLFL
jgi:hypothetical protein